MESVIETQKIISESLFNYYDNNNEYYTEILLLMNIIFKSKSKQILKIEMDDVYFDDDILLKYNNIIIKYKLHQKLFNIDLVDVDTLQYHEQVDILICLVNNLLEKLNYKIYYGITCGVKKLKIKINNEVY